MCSSAPSSIKRSSVLSTTISQRASGLSILFTTTITFNFLSSAFFKTNRVWGMGPSCASTSKRHPSAIVNIRSTSPPKSACPGVSMILILVSFHWIAAFLEKIVMPRSRSSSLESMISSCSAISLCKCVSDWRNKASTNVVFP